MEQTSINACETDRTDLPDEYYLTNITRPKSTQLHQQSARNIPEDPKQLTSNLPLLGDFWAFSERLLVVTAMAACSPGP